MAFHGNIAERARDNTDFRREIITGTHSQVVLMSIPQGGEIGEEVHEDTDQTLVFVAGQGEAILDGVRSPITIDTLYFVPAGTRHNFINTGQQPLKLFTVYAPPEHAPGTIHMTKAEADAAEAEHRA
jgi:mannose-6-phosphate isomerase-like protein (cupin superfamily)